MKRTRSLHGDDEPSGTPRPRTRWSGPLLGAGQAAFERPGIEVGLVAERLGLSRRRFIEIFSEDVGMSPKRYSRVRRFQRALSLATSTPTPRWADLALECGYFDQAHLCREWGQLTGVSPSQFLLLRTTPAKEGHLALPEGVKSVQYASTFGP